MNQGCPQDVKSQDRDETFHFSNSQDREVEPSRPRRDWDVPFSQNLKTKTRLRHFKKRPEKAVSQFKIVKSVTWKPVSCGSEPLFSSWYIQKLDALHVCSQDLKSWDPRPRHYIFKIETRLRCWTLKTETRPQTFRKMSRDRLETETCPHQTLSKRLA